MKNAFALQWACSAHTHSLYRRGHKKTVKLASSLAVIALIATGCVAPSSTGGAVTEDRSGTNAELLHPESHGESPPADSRPDYVAEFGQAYEWEDGLLIKVSEPKPYKPSKWACCPENSENLDAVMFTVKIVNGTNKPWNPDDWFYATLLAGSTEAQQVHDSDKLTTLTTRVLPGREGKTELAFMVETTDPERLQLDVTPSSDLATTSWVGSWN